MKFKNYSEQVSYSVSSIVLFTEYPKANEYYYEEEDLLERFEPDESLALEEFNIDNNTNWTYEELQKEENENVFDEFYEYCQDWQLDSIGDVCQWYAVNLKNGYDDYAKALGVFYDEALDLYILPVTHFGSGWDIVPQMEFNY